MTQPSRRYSASPLIVQQPRVEPLPSPVINWREIRRWIVPLSLLVAAVGLYLLQTSYATTAALDIQRMAAEREIIQHHNAQLAAEIAELEKPSRIRERAATLGMVEVSRNVRLAVRPVAAVPAGSMPEQATLDADASLWERLVSTVARWLAAQ